MPRTRKMQATDLFEFSPKQLELCLAKADKRLAVGGIRSGKTTGALMYGLFRYVLKYPGVDILILRRTFRELEAGAITDLRTFATVDGKPTFEWNDTKHIATFPIYDVEGKLQGTSRAFFGSCTHNRERDIEQYLGQGYPFILLDECGQFSPDAWELLLSRNTVNPGCKPDAYGNLPRPVIWGCTNPIGPFWLYYKTLFVDKKPVGVEGAVRDPDTGKWFVAEGGERRCVYDPAEYACVHSTVLDNPTMLKRDPKIIARLNAMPTAKRDKMLFGLLDRVEGQYFDEFNPTPGWGNVLNLREDPDSIIWQPYQAVWAGWDWGMAHHNTIYFFTKAMVRRPGGSYKQKTVCFAEIVVNMRDQHLDQDAVVELVVRAAGTKDASGKHHGALPYPFRLSAIYFSHEKFARTMEQHSPADILSNKLRERGQCMVTPATRDRIGRATFTYQMLQTGDLVILDTCPEIINALPTLQRDPDRLDDVLKVDNKADDCYDGFSYGLFGQLGTRRKPQEQADRERLESIKDPFARRLVQFKLSMDNEAPLSASYQEPWESRLQYPDGHALKP